MAASWMVPPGAPPEMPADVASYLDLEDTTDHITLVCHCLMIGFFLVCGGITLLSQLWGVGRFFVDGMRMRGGPGGTDCWGALAFTGSVLWTALVFGQFFVVAHFCGSKAVFALPVPDDTVPWLIVRAALNVAGAVIMVGCTVTFIFVHFNLGRNWSSVPDALADHQLVTHGVYRYSRHPMYASFLWAVPGILLIDLSWLLPLSWALGVILLLVPRLPQEEEILERLFGKEYGAYQHSVPPLGPGTHWLTPLYAPGTVWRKAMTWRPAWAGPPHQQLSEANEKGNEK